MRPTSSEKRGVFHSLASSVGVFTRRSRKERWNEAMICSPMHQLSIEGTSSQTMIESPPSPDCCRTALAMNDDCRVVMRLPSKKRLLVRTRLPPPELQPYQPETSSSSRTTKKRTVRFSLSKNSNDVIKTIHRYPKPSVKHYPNLYFSDHEKAEIQFLASSVGETFVFEEDEMVERLEAVFYKCDKEYAAEQTKRDIQDKMLANKENIADLKEWANTEARGLEDVVSPEFEDVRRRTVAMVLEYQDYLRRTLGKNHDFDELMRSFCEKNTLRSRKFSTLMAQGDTYVSGLQDDDVTMENEQE